MPLPPRIPEPQIIWRGDNHPPFVIGFGTEDMPTDLTGSTFKLDIEWRATRLSLGTAPDGFSVEAPEIVVDLTAKTVSWPYTVERIASIPRGARVTYNFRRYIGETRQTWAWGVLLIQDAQSAA